MRSHHVSRFTGALAVAALVFGLGHSASAVSLFTQVPVVRMAITGVESQAKLADQLRAQGYTDVVLASQRPNTTHPFPQLNPVLTNDAARTPVHPGWNGVAVKNGTTYQVYASQM
ncbi:MAG: hypothetical protein PHU07_04585 [Acidocella sp.]|nr:hypothetical protein [Acidocella sp.]